MRRELDAFAQDIVRFVDLGDIVCGIGRRDDETLKAKERRALFKVAPFCKSQHDGAHRVIDALTPYQLAIAVLLQQPRERFRLERERRGDFGLLVFGP